MRARMLVGAVAALAACQTAETSRDASPSPQAVPLALAASSVAPPWSAQRAPVPWCPLLVQGTTVEAQDTPNGAALVFHTTGDVNAVRAHVRQMADVHNRMAADGGPPMMGRGAGSNAGGAPPMMGRGAGSNAGGAPPMMGRGAWGEADSGQHGMGMGHRSMMGSPGMGREMNRHAMARSNARVEDTDDGARLVLIPASRTDLEVVREHARWRAERMPTGPCAMTGNPALDHELELDGGGQVGGVGPSGADR